MNLIINTEQFQPFFVSFLERKPNMIIDGVFSKILYTTNHFITNGIYIQFPINPLITKNSTNELEFDPIKNKQLINYFIAIEKKILQLYQQFFQLPNKHFVYDIETKLSSGSCKIYPSSHYQKYTGGSSATYYIKIAGIWETEQKLGLTYKIIEYHSK